MHKKCSNGYTNNYVKECITLNSVCLPCGGYKSCGIVPDYL